MKYLKILLGIILLLVIFFFAKGLLTPSVDYENTVTVDKSAQESWAVMSDESNLPKWIDGFIRSELVSGTENTVGAVSHVYVDEGGTEMMMKETIVSVKEGDHLSMKFEMDMMNMDYEIHFKEQGDKTVISSKSSTVGNGIFYKSILSFMPSAMKAQEEKNLNSLKKLIDENAKDYFQEKKPFPELTEVEPR